MSRERGTYTRRVLPSFQMDAIRAEEFCNSALRPLAWHARQLLTVEVAHYPQRVPHTQATRSKIRQVETGYRWGPIWSTAWFRLRGRLGRDFRGERVLLRFSSGTEATLWLDGVPHAGFDPYHDTAPLIPADWRRRERAKGGERIDLWVEAACNLPLGATTFWWDQPEQRARWAESKPGRLECAEVVAIDEEVWQFCERFDWLRRLLWQGGAEDSRTHDLSRGLAAIIRAIPAATATRADVLAMRSDLDRLLKGRADSRSPTTCVAIGHAHIDTAWLWRIDETRRKCVRSFATALRNIERFPHFRFLCSQAQQYQFVKEESPALFGEIRAAVRARRWEPNGAMWIEPDGTAPSGESFIRQIVHGTRFWQREFGVAAPQRFLYLPDTFGFPACLPQIIAKAGLDTFITNKIIWSDTNVFPHVSFRWRGLDSTEVLAHFTPGHNYNSDFVPADLTAAARNIEKLDKGRTRTYLQPYGWGDGGGGPDPAQIERTHSAGACEGVPSTTHTTAADFCATLHAEAAASERRGTPMPVWDGELYLEAHRGTYTSQRWIKRANRHAENLLREVEMLAVLSPLGATARRALVQELDSLWKTVLLHQFHDILPGSSIGPVYDDARAAMGTALKRLAALRDAGLTRARRQLGLGLRARVAFNPASVASGGLPPCSVGVPSRAPRDSAIAATPTRLTNDLLDVRLDALGRVSAIGLIGETFLPRAGHAFNELVLYEDRPRRWEAWDTDKEYAEKPTPVTTKARVKASVRGGVARVVVERSLGLRSSSIRQTYELAPGSDVLVIRSRLDWREERTLLRALFPTRMRARTARFGTQFGHIDRDAHRNTSWQEAQFEVPGHDWMSLTDGAQTFAVLDDGIFGKSAHDGSLGLSLAKSPNFPDPKADRGVHEFAYAIQVGPSTGSIAWSDAERLNRGVGGAEFASRDAASTSPALEFVTAHLIDGGEGVEVAALKPADDGSGDVIVRLVDRTGAAQMTILSWHCDVRRAVRCDFFERPLKGRAGALAMFGRAGKREPKQQATILATGPFEITSIRVTPR